MQTTTFSLLIIGISLSQPAMAVAQPSTATFGREATHVSTGRTQLAQSNGPKGMPSAPAPQAASPESQDGPASSRPEARPETRVGGRAPVNDAYIPPASKAAGNPAANAEGRSAPAPRPLPANQSGNTYGGPSAQPWSQPAKPVAAAPVAAGSMEPRDPSLPRPPASTNRWDSSGPSGPPARGPVPKTEP